MKTVLTSLKSIAVVALLVWATGCASTKHAEQTEHLLTQAGFIRVAASSEKQMKDLKNLPVDKLTVVKIRAKTYYVFPNSTRTELYVGNPEAYQSYQQLLSYQNLNAQSRVMGDLGEDTGGDEDKWADWTNNTGWTYGSD